MAGLGTALFAAAALALLAGCSPSADEQANRAVEAPKEKPPHCFFKDSETAGWALKVADGKAVVTGRAFRSDSRYKAVLLEPKIVGRVAEIRPSIANNDTGFAAEGNWWDLKAEIPAEGIEAVEVRCGKKLVASLPLAG
jgi:hypothetical protein